MHKSIFFNLVTNLKKHIDAILDVNSDNYEEMHDYFEICRSARALIRCSFRSEVMLEYPSELLVGIK